MTEFIATKIEDIHWDSNAFGDLALWAIPPIKALCFALDTAIEDDDLDTGPVLVNAIVAQLDALEETLRRLEDERMKTERKVEKQIEEGQNPFPNLAYCDQEKIMVFLENIEHQLGVISEPFKEVVKALDAKSKAPETDTSHKDSAGA